MKGCQDTCIIFFQGDELQNYIKAVVERPIRDSNSLTEHPEVLRPQFFYKNKSLF